MNFKGNRIQLGALSPSTGWSNSTRYRYLSTNITYSTAYAFHILLGEKQFNMVGYNGLITFSCGAAS